MSRLLFALLFAVGTAAANPFLEGKWPNTDFSRATIDISEVMSGGPPRDGIPAIDAPKFDDVEQAQSWLAENEPVIAVVLEEQAHAYPLQLLIYHEIVNDRIGQTPISVTFCPLCNSSQVFDRRLGGRVLDFGTTGLLRKSDMVMYDRQTESWWQQIVGQGIVGEYAGVTLEQVPSRIVSFAEFAAAYPAGKVVNRDTGYQRPYGNNPYRGYDRIDQSPFLYRGKLDPRLPPMERVINVRAGASEKLYPFSRLSGAQVLNDNVGETPVVLFIKAGLLSVLDAGDIRKSRKIAAVTAYERQLDGRILAFAAQDGRLIDEQTGSSWNLFGQALTGPLKGRSLKLAEGGIHFAFAWLAFNPGAEIYQAP